MTCEHRSITTWEFEGGKSAGVWSCTECHQKFVPITEMFDAVAAEREACAKVCDELDRETYGVFPVRVHMVCTDIAAAIRARGEA